MSTQTAATKRCLAPLCNKVLPLDAFNRRRDGRDGREARCRECRNPAKRLAAAANRALKRETIREDDEAMRVHAALLPPRPMASTEWFQALVASGGTLKCAPCGGKITGQPAEFGRVDLVCMICGRLSVTIEGESDREARLLQERVKWGFAHEKRRGRPMALRRAA